MAYVFRSFKVFGVLSFLINNLYSQSVVDYFERGADLHYMGDYQGAYHAMTTAINLEQDNIRLKAAIYAARGTLNKDFEHYDKAIQDFTEAVNLFPYPDWFYERGWCKQVILDYEGAYHDFDTVLMVKPENAKAYAFRGTQSALMGEHKIALTDFNQAIELDNELAFAFMQRGTTYLLIGKRDKACADLQRAIDLDQSNALDAYNMYCK